MQELFSMILRRELDVRITKVAAYSANIYNHQEKGYHIKVNFKNHEYFYAFMPETEELINALKYKLDPYNDDIEVINRFFETEEGNKYLNTYLSNLN